MYYSLIIDSKAGRMGILKKRDANTIAGNSGGSKLKVSVD